MEVEVVLGEVREADGRKLRGDEAPLADRDRRGLHRAGLVAGLQHRAQSALQVGRLRRRQPGRLAASADAPLDRAQQPAWTLRGVQDRRQQHGRRRLAVGARDAGHVQLATRVAVERVGQLRHARARVVAHDLRHRELRQLALDEQCRSAVGYGGGCVIVAVGASPEGRRTATRVRSARSGRRCRRHRRRPSRRPHARRRRRPCTARRAPRKLESSVCRARRGGRAGSAEPAGCPGRSS